MHTGCRAETIDMRADLDSLRDDMSGEAGPNAVNTITTVVNRILKALGVNRKRSFVNLRHTRRFLQDLIKYQTLVNTSPFRIRLRDLHPMLRDYDAMAGRASGHYFWQDLWAARKVFRQRPPFHVDIGSRVDGFVAHLLTFMSVEVLDVRPLKADVDGLVFVRDDATELSRYQTNSLISVSSLHAAEHFGLGRYGDPIDPVGHAKFAAALQRVLARGGHLYFSVPMGRERLEFNAHRIFAPSSVISLFPELTLLDFAFVDDSGSLHEHQRLADVSPEMSYGCGLFEFTKTA